MRNTIHADVILAAISMVCMVALVSITTERGTLVVLLLIALVGLLIGGPKAVRALQRFLGERQ